MAGRYKTVVKQDRTLDDIVFDSKAEMLRYAELRLLESAKKISHLACQPQFDVKINNEHFCTYTADFEYFDIEADEWVYEDVKSDFTNKDPAFRLRQKAASLFFGIEFRNVINGVALTKKKLRRRFKK